MATKTPNLGLIKPARAEYENTWDIAVNKNSDLLDGFVSDLQSEIIAARGTKSSLNDRIGVSISADGSIRDVAEVVSARNSPVYGNATSGTSHTLAKRMEQSDREIFSARAGADSLAQSLAQLNEDFVPNSVISAPSGFLSFTGSVVKIDATTTPVVCNINGYRQVVRGLKSATVAGPAGTYYVYLTKTASGETYLDRSGTGQNNGVVSTDTTSGLVSKFSDSSQNFTVSGVAPGDVLEITSSGSANKGEYIVHSVLDNTSLLIVGVFPASQSNLGYKLTNLFSPSLTVDALAHPKRYSRQSSKICVGRAIFDGSNVTDVQAYALKGRYEQFVNASLTSGNFSQTLSHKLGFFPSRVEVYASQASDYSLPLEPLSVGDVSDGTSTRSVLVKMDDTTISIKNAAAGILYKSFDGVSYTSGYLLVVVER